MDITYRPAKQEDLEEAERVAQQSGNALRVRHGGRPSTAPPSIAFPEFCLAQDPAGLWVAEDGGTIVGFGFSWMTEKFWFLSQLFVRPEMQAKGIGQAERNSAANRALITFAYNIASTGLYLQNGLYPRELLYRMAAPAQAVAEPCRRRLRSHTDSALARIWRMACWRMDWPDGSGAARVPQRSASPISARPLCRARSSDRARGPHRRLCLHLRRGSCRSAGNRTGC